MPATGNKLDVRQVRAFRTRFRNEIPSLGLVGLHRLPDSSPRAVLAARGCPAGAERPPGGQRAAASAAAASTGVASAAAALPDATAGAAVAVAALQHLGVGMPAAALGPPAPAPAAWTVIPPPAASVRPPPCAAVRGAVAPATAWVPSTGFGRTPVVATGAEAGGLGGRAASVIPGALVPASPSSRPPPTASASSVIQPAAAARRPRPAAAAWPAPPRDAGSQGPGPLLAVPISAAAAAGRSGQASGPSAVHARATVAVCLVCITHPTAMPVIRTKARAAPPILTRFGRCPAAVRQAAHLPHWQRRHRTLQPRQPPRRGSAPVCQPPRLARHPRHRPVPQAGQGKRRAKRQVCPQRTLLLHLWFTSRVRPP